MAKDRFGHGTDQLKEAWKYTSDNAPIFYHDYTQTSGGHKMMEDIMSNIVKNHGVDSWKSFIKNYESRLKSGEEGPGEFLFEHLGQAFPELYGKGER